MKLIAEIPSLIDYASNAIAGGYLIALSLICLLQYLVHLHRLARERREHARVKAEFQGLQGRFEETQQEWSIASVENDVLRDFLAVSTPAELVRILLQHVVPEPGADWAAYIDLRSKPRTLIGIGPSESISPIPEARLAQQRGLKESPSTIRGLDDDCLVPAFSGQAVVLREPGHLASPFLQNFSAVDRQRVSQLYVFAVGQGEVCNGLLVTSRLFPAEVSVDQQTELIQRLCVALAQHLESSVTQAVQEQELRASTERLAVRTLFDQRFDNLKQVMQLFLRHVQTRFHAERGVLFVELAENTGETPSYVASGVIPLPRQRETWERTEVKLANLVNETSGSLLLDDRALKEMGVSDIIRAAIVIPLIRKSKLIGRLCLTRSTPVPFTLSQQQLGDWASELLVDKMSEFIQHAAVTRMAQLDAVTQIANRHTFDNELAHELEIAYATSSEMSVILLDIDHFKSVNDTHGHQAGDDVLRIVGQILRDSLAHLRADDRAVCARYGGDEFAVILPGMGPLGAARIAEVVRNHVRQMRIVWQDQPILITVSGGFATYPENGLTGEKLIAVADAALLNAKGDGRDVIGWPEAIATEAAEPRSPA